LNAVPRLPVSPSDGHEVARGLVNYGSSDARRIARRASQAIEGILGYIDEPEIIHRDNLILT
jgi:glutamate 5-kinase